MNIDIYIYTNKKSTSNDHIEVNQNCVTMHNLVLFSFYLHMQLNAGVY